GGVSSPRRGGGRGPAPGGAAGGARRMWASGALREGALGVEPREFTDNRGGFPPVMHVDSSAPLYDDVTGDLITDRMWGIYYKPDFDFGGVQGGTSPYVVNHPAGDVAVDPYGPASPEYTVTQDFVRMWTSALAHCHKRFEGKRDLYRHEPTGGIRALTPDSLPLFHGFRPNPYLIPPPPHPDKMIAVGAGRLAPGACAASRRPRRRPSRSSGSRAGTLPPTSKPPSPWTYPRASAGYDRLFLAQQRHLLRRRHLRHLLAERHRALVLHDPP